MFNEDEDFSGLRMTVVSAERYGSLAEIVVDYVDW